MTATARTAVLGTCILFTAATPLAGQDEPVRWQRRTATTQSPVTVFHSTQTANLPTAETIERGELEIEISHRFLPTLSDGSGALWGLDGPVFNRLGLSVGFTDRLMVGLVRSNLDDNLDLNAKVRVGEGRAGAVSFMLGLAGGVALNTGVEAFEGLEDNETQAWALGIVNLLLGERVALGVLPGYLYNPRLADIVPEHNLSVGLAGQAYLSDLMSLFGEWNLSRERADLEHQAGAFGFELETGGHFFKILLTNTVRLNPSQYLGGTPFEFGTDQWRLGFNVTRRLHL